MNVGIFGSYLLPVWQSNTPKSISDAAEKIATAYHISNVGQSTTPFAAPLINADKDILKTFLEMGMSINFYGGQIQSSTSTILGLIRGAIGGNASRIATAEKMVNKQLSSIIGSLPAPLSFIGGLLNKTTTELFDKLKSDNNESGEMVELLKRLEGIIKLADTTKIGFLVMATGFCLYWLTSKMSPVPPMPPCIAPTVGTQVIFPGSPIPLNSDLHDSFKYPQTPDQAIAKLYNSLILHQFTIVGTYSGIVPFFPAPIPAPPLPWFSILNIPFPDV